MATKDFTPAELDRLQPIVVSVVGPTNQGKTCVIRTLSEDAEFGEVRDEAGVTKFTQAKKFRAVGTECFRLCDTPGFQMSEEILDSLQQRDESYGPAEILQEAQNAGDEAQEDLRAWQQIEQSQVLLYVIDIYERPRARLKADLQLLIRSGRPVIPLYNFLPKGTAQDASHRHYLEEWQEVFRGNNIHLDTVYDAHERNQRHERRLLERIKVHLSDPLQEKALQLIIDAKEIRERRRAEQAVGLLAELLLDCAAYREVRREVPKTDRKGVAKDLQDALLLAIRQRDHDTQVKIIGQWGFDEDRLGSKNVAGESHIDSHRDWLAKDVLKHFGVSMAASAGIGTAVGIAFDVITGGSLIGLPTFVGTAVGTALGASYSGLMTAQYDEQDWKVTARVEPAILRILLCRNLDLINRVRRHGKGKNGDIALNAKPPLVDDKALLAFLREQSGQHYFTSLKETWQRLSESAQHRRRQSTERLVELLLPLLETDEE